MRLLLSLILLALTGCIGRPAANEDARLVVAQFLAARQSRNLEATMECLAANPEMRSSQGVGWSGREAVKAIMAFRLTDTYVVGDLHVNGDRVSWTEHVTRNTGAPPTPGGGRGPANFDEEVEAVVVGGRIASLTTYVGGARPDAQALAVGSAATDLLVPLSVLLLVAAAVLVWPSSISGWRTPAVAPTHQLMNGLREYVARRG